MKMDGLKIAISASDAPDRARLGMPAREVDRALLAVCTALVREGCDILYAGNLSPDQYTFKIFRHLAGAYAGARIEAPFLHVIAEPIARRTSFDSMRDALKENGAIARTRISIGGDIVPARSSGAKVLLGERGAHRKSIESDAEWASWLGSYAKLADSEAYTAARAFVTAQANGRVAIGGKMGMLSDAADQYEGAMPGVVEEAIMSLEADQPFIPLGAYGGATRDVAIALGLLSDELTVPRGNQQQGYAEAIARLVKLASRVPNAQRALLSQIADDDRCEAMSFSVVEAILGWRVIPDDEH